MTRARLTAMQAHHCSSEGALSTLEEAIEDKEKQMAQLREQRDRAEQEKQEERELHEREIAEYKMKIHALESEVGEIFFPFSFFFFLLTCSFFFFPFSFSSCIKRIDLYTNINLELNSIHHTLYFRSFEGYFFLGKLNLKGLGLLSKETI